MEEREPSVEKEATRKTLFGRSEEWLARHTLLLALVILGLGLVLRLHFITACYLNPDEAIHILLGRHANLDEAYQDSLTQAHPPLLTVVLYFLQHLGHGVFLLRLPNLVAATLGTWFLYRWCRDLFGKGAALGLLILLTFSPAMFLPAVEIRQYGLLILGIGGALLGLERAFTRVSVKWLVWGNLGLCVALLSHYSAIWVVASLGCWGLLRLVRQPPGRRFVLTWTGFQLLFLLLYLLFYFTHVRQMQNDWMQEFAVTDYLREGYPQEGNHSLLAFFGDGLVGIFGYLGGGRGAGLAGALFFAASLAALALVPIRPVGERRRDLVLLLSLPLLLGALGTILELQPFKGSRHTTYLLPFLAAGIAFLLLRWVRYPVLAAMVAGLLGVAPLALSFDGPAYELNNDPITLPRQDLERALTFVLEEGPAERLLITDYQTSVELRFYLGKRMPKHLVAQPWVLNEENFPPLVRMAKHSCGVRPGDRLWAVSTCWRTYPPLTEVIPGEMVVRAEQFGRISLVQFRVPARYPRGDRRDG